MIKNYKRFCVIDLFAFVIGTYLFFINVDNFSLKYIIFSFAFINFILFMLDYKKWRIK